MKIRLALRPDVEAVLREYSGGTLKLTVEQGFALSRAVVDSCTEQAAGDGDLPPVDESPFAWWCMRCGHGWLFGDATWNDQTFEALCPQCGERLNAAGGPAPKAQAAINRARTWAWINHAALNIGAALACIWYAVMPPWRTGHDEDTVLSLAREPTWKAFWDGMTR